MEYTQIIVEKKGQVTIITINRPEAYNSLQPITHLELNKAFDDFENDSEVYVAIITGAGEKAFCSGNDLKYMANRTPEQKANATKEMEQIKGFGGITERFDSIKPIIAAVNGGALGGGMEICLACDLIVSADHAVFGLPEVTVGVNALAGGLYRLQRHIPFNKAMELVLTGRHMPAQEAYELGLVNIVTTADRLMEEALKLANRICKNAPLAVQASKQVLYKSLEYDIRDCFDMEKYPAIQLNLKSEDFLEGPRAFAQKRKPQWKGK